ncbi:MAG: hypothetical protein VKQ33_09755 [Candidatus Sericytochromatia bacterium]|nr:hypothetical protein [Candidatus Sericytochromatia bacterium]
MHHLKQALAAAALAATLAGCGSQGLSVAGRPAAAPTFETLAASTLKKAFNQIHRAIFDNMDADKDGWLTEYEVGKHMTMAQFRKADTKDGWGSAGRLSRTEFLDYATKTFLWFRQDKDSFANTFRQGLVRAFHRFDENRDGLLVKSELSRADLRRVGLSFEYPKLRLSVKITKVTPELIAGSDKTGDGKLSQAEFEDLYIEMVIAALGGSSAPAAPPAPPMPPAPPLEPAPPAPLAPAGLPASAAAR